MSFPTFHRLPRPFIVLNGFFYFVSTLFKCVCPFIVMCMPWQMGMRPIIPFLSSSPPFPTLLLHHIISYQILRYRGVPISTVTNHSISYRVRQYYDVECGPRQYPSLAPRTHCRLLQSQNCILYPTSLKTMTKTQLCWPKQHCTGSMQIVWFRKSRTSLQRNTFDPIMSITLLIYEAIVSEDVKPSYLNNMI